MCANDNIDEKNEQISINEDSVGYIPVGIFVSENSENESSPVIDYFQPIKWLFSLFRKSL